LEPNYAELLRELAEARILKDHLASSQPQSQLSVVGIFFARSRRRTVTPTNRNTGKTGKSQTGPNRGRGEVWPEVERGANLPLRPAESGLT